MAVAKKARSSRGVKRSESSASPADVVDQSLAKYRSMRNFDVTAEPSGKARSAGLAKLPFCVQKHAASHLHYDFRLGWAGVLKSWAVAKGPSYVTADRRLAVEVEDHPMEYGGFEGIIPAGQYGGGTVMLWDQGTWEPQPGHEDVEDGLRKGSLKFILHGERLQGRWTLVRMGGRAANERKPNWLLIKEHDEHEQAPGEPGITETAMTSVATGRTMEEIAATGDHVWNSKETAGTGQAWYRKTEPDRTAKTERAAPAKKGTGPAVGSDARLKRAIGDLPKERQPSFVKPELATEAVSPPDGKGWLHELKLDGYRIQARKSGKEVALLTRTGLDWTYRVPAVGRAVAALPCQNVTLDGEVVVLAEDGTTNFADLQASFQEQARHPLTYFCFDLLHLEGHSTRDLPLSRRKEILSLLLPPGEAGEVRLSEHLEGSGPKLFQKACDLRAEGLISKRADTLYKSGRGTDWVKSKCLHEQEFVIGGFTVSAEGPDRIGSLLIGYYKEKKLIYAGRTGTGFTQQMKRSLRKRLHALEQVQSPFARVPAEARRDAVWVRPELVTQVRFASWTAEDLVRQAAFLGLREDKPAVDVRREEATYRPKREVTRAEKAGTHAVSRKEEPVRSKRTPPAAQQDTTSPRPQPLPIRLTHPAKILDTETSVSKEALAHYYWSVADRMLPHIADRPLSLVRCPEGSEKPCFYQKHVNHLLPAGVTSVSVPDKKGGPPEPYITLHTREALAGLAQMGVLEIHPWGSCNSDLEHPNRIVFDLDPDEALPWRSVADAALDVRDRLKKAGLQSFLKTTGGKGLHVVTPILPTRGWDFIKTWAHDFVLKMERQSPSRYLTKMTKAARTGRIYLDYLRNERGATAVAPFSPRARRGLPVSLPLAWSELKAQERPVFRVAEFSAWQTRLRKDPWAAMSKAEQELV